MKRPNKLTLMGGGRLDTVGHVRHLPVALYLLTVGPGCMIGACAPSPVCGRPLAGVTAAFQASYGNSPSGRPMPRYHLLRCGG